MDMMVSQIISLTIVYSTIYSGADKKKHQSSTSPVTGEFPAQMASNAEMFPFDDVIMADYKIKHVALIYEIFQTWAFRRSLRIF